MKEIEIDPKYPGIAFFKLAATGHITITSSETTFNHLEDMGISIYFPESALSSDEEPLKLHIRPCLSGRFELPSDYDSASPAYFIWCSKKIKFQKDITLKIHHYASLESEKHCKDMTFLSASLPPECCRESRPVYTFKKIPGTKGVFRSGDQVGEITLRHFCAVILGKRKREVQGNNGTLHSL